MSLPLYIKHTFSFIFYSVLLISCNSVSNTKNDKIKTDTIALIDLPKAGSVSAIEAQRVKSASQLWYDTVLKASGFNGGMIVAENGNILFEAYNGTGHLPGTDSITQNTPLHVASVSKTFTAMAVLKLMQDGKLNIDDELSKYFPTFNYPGVTIRSLLSHRSGLPNYIYFMANSDWDKTKFVTNQDIFNFLVNRKAELVNLSAPNTHFAYSNTNFALLALLIEKVTGIKYAAFLQQTFFTPLQMKNTFVFQLADSTSSLRSYDWKGRMEPYDFLDEVYGDKNIYTTPRDLLIWDSALTSNVLFKPETLEQAYAPYSNEKAGIRNYGLGWRMYVYPDGKKIVYHNGRWHGSNAAFIRLISNKATIIVIGNRFNRSIYHAKVLASLFGDYFGEVDEEEAPVADRDSVLAALKNTVKPDSGKTSYKKEKIAMPVKKGRTAPKN